MAVMMASMNVVVAGVQAARDVVSIRSQVHLGSATRLGGGLRLNVAGNRSCVPLRSSPRRSIVVVCAEEDVTKKGQNAVDGAASKVKVASDAAKGKVQDAAGAAKSKLEHAGDTGSKAQNACEDAGDSLKRNAGNAMSSTVYSGKGIEEKINWNRAQLAYVIVYAPDVNKAADFYNKAFGLEIRPQNKSNSWVEMETGATTLAFTPEKQHETDLTGALSSSGSNRIVINLDFSDVEAAYKHAISQGATAVAPPEDKSWPQKVGYVKDINGNIVRLGSFPAM